ncbi:DNA oxidative demethylase ALKBH2 [Araneus ventricosus]|uniref:DNA oxidative demethylase ALKBH2 n=3 Tax=Araneus ventricosus TaxID=182803 RepID=A0A4Y2KDD0_ARAVE|nr:DNA oxidative demethylase ALKBH2 [Araneus ventricosus]GBN16618.1 DNA oxidative demethylase ALKBH2 [Araneus ventricosus]
MSSPNITYIPNFYSQEECNEMFTKLSKCPFKQPIIKVWGKSYRPLRKSCSYGDMDIEYEYSGHCELPLPWNRTLWKIKSDVEKKTGFEYNFVLLNFYESGQAKIGAHKDDEPSLDPSVDIATLSFGACRDMIFSKKGCKSVRQALEAGSLLLMHDQKEWTHAIPPQPCVKEPRISLTFRRVWSSLQQSLDEMERDYSIPLCKRLRRD